MAKYPITELSASAFGPLTGVDITLSPQLNIITGDNATGKSQLLKLLYASTQVLGSQSELTKSWLQTQVADKLVGVFRPEALGRLVQRVRGRNRAEVAVKFANIGNPFAFAFSSVARSEVKITSVPGRRLEDTPVFLPSRELLSLYPGLVSLFETREVEFDETWRDTAILLGRSPLRGPRGDRANEILAPLSEVMEGQVIEESGRFYVRLPIGETGTGKIEAPLVSEGFRKTAMVIRLVSSGVLLEGGYLFWDEPEANLNPMTQRAAARAIAILSKHGTQVFVATHSVFLLRELEIIMDEMAESEDGSIDVRYIGLYKQGENSGEVMAESVEDPADLSSIAALNAEARQSLRYLGLGGEDD